MSRVLWRPLWVAGIFLTFVIENKQAANVGGGEMNELPRSGVTTGPIISGGSSSGPHPPTTGQPPPPSSTISRGLLLGSSGNLLNFTVQSGTRVTLHCQVQLHDENASVSWLKRKGESLQLLSVNMDLFKDDPRYRINLIKPSDWQLYIDPVNLTDQGYYECQVSSHPPIVHSLYLHVLVPELEIADERNLPIKNKFYNSGSTIELRCLIVKVPHPTQFIIWKHNSTILNYDTTRGGISVKTDILRDGAKSQLYIANVGPSDSGNYSCSLGEEAVTTVSVVVITGESPAAMQHGSGTSVNVGLLTLLSLALCLLS